MKTDFQFGLLTVNRPRTNELQLQDKMDSEQTCPEQMGHEQSGPEQLGPKHLGAEQLCPEIWATNK